MTLSNSSAELVPNLPQTNAKPASPGVFGPTAAPVQYNEEGVAALMPYVVRVSHEEVLSSRGLGHKAAHLPEVLARRTIRDSLGPTAARLALFDGSAWNGYIQSYECRFRIPADLVPKQKYDYAPSQVPDTISVEATDIELGKDKFALGKLMQRKLVALVGEELAGRAVLTAESFDGKRKKYINVYRLPGGSLRTPEVAAQRTKPFERSAPGKRLIRKRKADSDE